MPTAKPAFFFSATQSVDDRLGDVFSFIWASYSGLRELWWQVRGFNDQFPDLHISQLEKKFLSGLPMPGGIDFKKVFIQTDWDEHESEFSKWLLFEACTLYEGWLEKICSDIFPPATYEKHVKDLQFPVGTKPNGQVTGYLVAVNAANSAASVLMKSNFFPTLKSSKLNCWSVINEYLIAYRFFKECRNSFIHSDGVVTTTLMTHYANIFSVNNQLPCPFRHSFSLPALTLNKKIVLNLKDCILFATIVRNLICTFDAALCVATQSELQLENRLKTLTKTGAKWVSLPSDPVKKAQRVHRMLSASRIPEPVNFPNMMAWMQGKGII